MHLAPGDQASHVELTKWTLCPPARLLGPLRLPVKAARWSDRQLWARLCPATSTETLTGQRHPLDTDTERHPLDTESQAHRDAHYSPQNAVKHKLGVTIDYQPTIPREQPIH